MPHKRPNFALLSAKVNPTEKDHNFHGHRDSDGLT